ncbi:MAG: YcxB family protein [Clostridiales bacterium]|nr:YcxB family protein [Clostridiales bacterium]
MEKRFETATVCTPPLYREFSEYHLQGLLRGTRLFFWACAGLLVLFATAALILGNRSVLPLSLSYLLAAVFLPLPWLVERAARRQAEKGGKEMDGAVDACVFYDDCFVETIGGMQTTAFYPRVVRAAETASCYYVYTSRSAAAVIAKDSFLVGDADGFRAFLKDRLGERFDPWKAGEED